MSQHIPTAREVSADVTISEERVHQLVANEKVKLMEKQYQDEAKQRQRIADAKIEADRKVSEEEINQKRRKSEEEINQQRRKTEAFVEERRRLEEAELKRREAEWRFHNPQIVQEEEFREKRKRDEKLAEENRVKTQEHHRKLERMSAETQNELDLHQVRRINKKDNMRLLGWSLIGLGTGLLFFSNL